MTVELVHCVCVAGDEFIDQWENLCSGAVMYFCSLCGCQFDREMIDTHTKSQEHRHQYKV